MCDIIGVDLADARSFSLCIDANAVPLVPDRNDYQAKLARNGAARLEAELNYEAVVEPLYGSFLGPNSICGELCVWIGEKHQATVCRSWTHTPELYVCHVSDPTEGQGREV